MREEPERENGRELNDVEPVQSIRDERGWRRTVGIDVHGPATRVYCVFWIKIQNIYYCEWA